MSALVNEELWRIFTFYTLHGTDTPQWWHSCLFPFSVALRGGDPEDMRYTQLLRLLSDCGLGGGGGGLLEADVACAFQAELTPRAPRDNNTPDAPLRMRGGATAGARADRPREVRWGVGARGWGSARFPTASSHTNNQTPRPNYPTDQLCRLSEPSLQAVCQGLSPRGREQQRGL